MDSLRSLKLIAPLVLGVGTLVLAGCEGTEGYSSEYPYNQPAYATNQPVYTNQYGQPVYPNGQPAYTGQPAYNGQVYSQYGQPAYSGQPAYGSAAADDYIYYPDTGVYFSPSLQLFYYHNGDHWEHGREAPRGWRRDESGVHVRLPGGPEHHDDNRRQYNGGWHGDHDRD